jgi:hypothetical protein
MRKGKILPGSVLLLAMTYSYVNAGEISGGTGSCDLKSPFLGCEWKPKDCFKPDAPLIIASTVSDYNFAVDRFNSYLREVEEYKQCLINDAKSDIQDRFPAIVVKGAKAESEQVDDDVQSTRQSLDLARSGVER